VLIDVNVLVAAHREDHPNHKIAEKWLNETVATATLASRFVEE
jgi:predicted nucleic acid-binding protein